jgi:hypothetical protein
MYHDSRGKYTKEKRTTKFHVQKTQERKATRIAEKNLSENENAGKLETIMKNICCWKVNGVIFLTSSIYIRIQPVVSVQSL